MRVNVYATARIVPAPSFPHTLVSRRDLSDPELGPHLRGFAGFVMAGGGREMTQSRYHVLRHLERVRNHLSLDVGEDQMDAFAAWARVANAIVFTSDTAVRTPGGAVLVDPGTGDPEQGAEVPYPEDALRRKAKTEAELRNLGVPALAGLPPVAGLAEVQLRGAREVAARCLALLAVAIRAESLASGQPLGQEEILRRLPLAPGAMSPAERAFFTAAAPPEQDVVNHAWRYEALAVLAWTLSRWEAGPATQTCDVPGLARAFLSLDGAAFLDDARRLPAEEILDALDLIYRLHWAARDARLHDRPAPAGLNEGVVRERHHALNWLTGFADAGWDEVDTPT